MFQFACSSHALEVRSRQSAIYYRTSDYSVKGVVEFYANNVTLSVLVRIDLTTAYLKLLL